MIFPILVIWEVSAKYPSHDTDVTFVKFFLMLKWYSKLLVITIYGKTLLTK